MPDSLLPATRDHCCNMKASASGKSEVFKADRDRESKRMNLEGSARTRVRARCTLLLPASQSHRSLRT
eukprot:9235925-Alexandrium_andersonii.AAC.1